MTTTTVPLPSIASSETPASPARRLLGVLPGMALLFGIGILGKGLEALCTYLRVQRHLPAPHIEYVLWAILIGLAISNTIGLSRVFRPGVATYELWLKLGIVLVGAKFLMQDVLHIGGLSLMLVAVELVLSLSVMHLLGRIFRLPPKLTSLLAIGSSICGVTAIMGRAGSHRARRRRHLDRHRGHPPPSAPSHSSPSPPSATPCTWATRPTACGPASPSTTPPKPPSPVPSIPRLQAASPSSLRQHVPPSSASSSSPMRSTGRPADKPPSSSTRAASSGEKFPKFILGFLAISVLATSGFFSAGQLSSLSNLSKWSFLPAFAGVGLRTNLRDLVGQGWRPLVVGILGEIFIALITLGLVYWSYNHGVPR